MLKESLRRISRILCLWLAVVGLVSPLSFSPTTEQVGLKDANGFITAFADFNADKATDVLVLNTTDGSQSAYLWDSQQYLFRPHPLTLPLGIPSNVRDTHAADFDGDGVVDVLVLSQSTDDCVLATVHWSAIIEGRVKAENLTEIATVKSLLTVLDANGDHLPDLLVTSCQDSLPKILRSNGEMRSFTETSLYGAGSDGPMTYYHASYFVDLNSDCLADIVIDGESGSEDERTRVLDVWLKEPESGDFEFSGRTLLPPPLRASSNYSRNLAFADMDADGILEVLGTACGAVDSCDKVTVSILYQLQFTGTDVLRCRASDTWKLNWAHVHHVELVADSPASYYGGEMSIGDVNLDGYPDILTTAAYPRENGGVQALVLLSTRCRSDCNGSKVTLEPRWRLFGDQTNISRAVFFDLEEDGRLDVLLMQRSTHPMTAGYSGEGHKLLAYQQNFKEDHAFLKVLALSGYCFSHCKSAMEPYGSVLPGAVVSFSTTDRNGGKKQSTATISHGSLQLPFIVFGLGHTPNFIEDLTIGVAHSGPGNKISYHQWSLLVPNSQVIVITVPPTDASRWRLELYLTPSRLVYSTAAILGGLFVGIAVLVLLLHGKERYQDSRERQQEKHRFHFNAM